MFSPRISASAVCRFCLLAIMLLLLLAGGHAVQPGAAAPAPQTGEATSRAPGRSTPQLIEQAFARGEIDPEQRLLYLIYALHDADRLPARFQSPVGWRGTQVAMEIARARADVASGKRSVRSPELQAALEFSKAQAATFCELEDRALTLQTANFVVNYDQPVGLSINQYAEALEQSFGTLVGSFDWPRPPLLDSNAYGRYPVQVAEIDTNTYGYVTYDNSYFIGNNPNTPATETAALASCMVLNNNFPRFTGGDSVRAHAELQVTVGHEYVHAIQLGVGDAPLTDDGEKLMWYESTAAYVEDEVLLNAESNYQYLWPQFDSCLADYPVSSGPTYPQYSNWLLFRYAAEHYGGLGVAGGGEEIYQATLANIAAGQHAVTAYDQALNSTRGTNLGHVFHSYAIAARAIPSAAQDACPAGSPFCFDRAAAMFNYMQQRSQSFPPDHGSIAGIGASYSGAVLDTYAINWVRLPANVGPFGVRLRNTASNGQLRISILALTPDGPVVTSPGTLASPSGSVSISKYTPPPGATQLVAVLTNQGISPTPNSCSLSSYQLEVLAPGPSQDDLLYLPLTLH